MQARHTAPPATCGALAGTGRGAHSPGLAFSDGTAKLQNRRGTYEVVDRQERNELLDFWLSELVALNFGALRFWLVEDLR